MTDEHKQELASLSAFDLLDGAESSAFEAELGRNPELQQLVRELRDASATLALSAPQVTPPSALKTRVMANIGQASIIKPEAPGQLLSFRPSVMIPWGLAAGFAVGCFWLGQLYMRSLAGNTVLQEQNSLVEISLSSSRQQLEAERILANQQLVNATQQLTSLNQQVVLSTEKVSEATRALSETFTQLDLAKAALASRQAELAQLNERLVAATGHVAKLQDRLQVEGDLAQFKIATLASMAGNSPQALAVAVWNPSTQKGLLRVEGLAALASDKDYQLWLIDPAYPAPVDGGVFTVDAKTGHAQVSFTANQRVNNAAKFAVSLERKGGVPKAEGPIVLLGD